MSTNGQAEKTGLRAAVKGIVMLALLGIAVYAAKKSGLDEMLKNTEWFDKHILGSGPLSVVIYLGVTMALSAVGIPRQILAFLGGFAFGAVGGTLLSTIGCGFGCGLAAGYARFFGREMVARRFGQRIKKIDAFLSIQPFRMALAIRLLPVGSNVLANLAAGVSSIPLIPFIFGSAVGYLPQNLIFALFGGGLNAESRVGMLLSVGVSVVLFVASGWLGVAAYRKYKAEMDAA